MLPAESSYSQFVAIWAPLRRPAASCRWPTEVRSPQTHLSQMLTKDGRLTSAAYFIIGVLTAWVTSSHVRGAGASFSIECVGVQHLGQSSTVRVPL